MAYLWLGGPLTVFYTFAHRCYGRWDFFRWCQWYDAWNAHIRGAKQEYRLREFAWHLCPTLV